MRREKFIIAVFLIILSIVTIETIYILFEKPTKSTSEKYSKRNVKPEMIKQKKDLLNWEKYQIIFFQLVVHQLMH